jgi:hypothetical protein
MYSLYKTKFGTISLYGEKVYMKSRMTVLGCSQVDLQILKGYYKLWHNF